ncbi:hypothetical protein [Rhodopila sp.]|uniref:hypothetical protein n=1 Tax=Rhodopila sp. TaxID=2480087 RepID=UPI003D0E8A94
MIYKVVQTSMMIGIIPGDCQCFTKTKRPTKSLPARTGLGIVDGEAPLAPWPDVPYCDDLDRPAAHPAATP